MILVRFSVNEIRLFTLHSVAVLIECIYILNTIIRSVLKC